MPRVLPVALASVLLLGTPALGQSAEEIEKLIAQLGARTSGDRSRAAKPQPVQRPFKLHHVNLYSDGLGLILKLPKVQGLGIGAH